MTVSDLEQLKKQVFTAIEAETSVDILGQIQAILAQSHPLVPPGVETRIEAGLADAAAGRVYTHEQYLELSQTAAEARKARYK